jgi:hemerythrin-like domain-containing protein
MCAHCGCESLSAVAELTAEHDLVVELVLAATSAIRGDDLDGAAELARVISAVLGPHSAVEERALFPAMVAECGDYVSGLLAEHRLIEAALSEAAEGTPTDSQWPVRLEHAFTVLRGHIVKEEAGLFPAALATLTTASWEAIDDMRATVGGQLRTNH